MQVIEDGMTRDEMMSELEDLRSKNAHLNNQVKWLEIELARYRNVESDL